MISFRVFAHGGLHIAGSARLGKLKQPWVSDIGLDSVVASETSADWRRVVTLAYPAFASTASLRVAKEDFMPPKCVRESLEILDMIAEPAPRIGTQAAAEASTQ
jgi:hypothetical protein